MNSKTTTQKMTDFPSYKDIVDKMEDYMSSGKSNSNNVMKWWAEFGQFNYEMLKICFKIMKNIKTDEDYNKTFNSHSSEYKTIRSCAEKIANRGGITALRANFYVFCNFYPPMMFKDKIEDEDMGVYYGEPYALNKYICNAWDRLDCGNGNIWLN